jgi:sialate O-acetylesterase
MMLARRTAVVVALLAFSALLAPAAHSRLSAQSPAPRTTDNTLRLARIFGSGMVLQRDQPLTIWGWAAPRAEVAVSLRGTSRRSVADATGAWRVTMPATAAGGPFTLGVRSGVQRLEIGDVLVGDVWIASGQSNMEWSLASALGGREEIARANDQRIRHFKVPVASSPDPRADLERGAWLPAAPALAGDFSAVGYFFAKRLRQSVDVPIGILNSSWGGSAIETWMSRTASGLSDGEWSAIQRREAAQLQTLREALRARIGSLPTADAGLTATAAPWADPALDDASWAEINVPAYWEPQDYDGMDGIAWYRVVVQLTDAERRSGATLSMAAIDDDDITWMNGVEIGRTRGYNVARGYRIPESALRTGRNVLVVRVADGAGGGGINGATTLTLGDGTVRSLAGKWKFRVGQLSFASDAQRSNQTPTVAYNAMIAPLLPFAVKGVIWYQGESNANNVAQAVAYRRQFRTLIASWRREWSSGRAPMPFLWVQLPNYGAPDSILPPAAPWATHRESMAAALSMPATGQAITIDIGDPSDIHPRNKHDVGDRLARVALAKVYGQRIISSGPTYRAHQIRGRRVMVSFDHTDGGLVSRAPDGRSIGAFAVAGSDGQFVRAQARIVGNAVEVWSDEVRSPVAVRYAWSNSPVGATLYNGERLPAAPFRTDR